MKKAKITRMGRPSKPENANRTKVWQVRLSPAEHAELLAMAHDRGTTVADMLRAWVKRNIAARRKGRD